jgi:hypothetical protein
MSKSFTKPETSTIIGKSLELDKRTFYPVVKISTLKNNEGNIKAIWVVPIAIVVEEDLKRFILPLVDENIDFDELAKIEDFCAVESNAFDAPNIPCSRAPEFIKF